MNDEHFTSKSTESILNSIDDSMSSSENLTDCLHEIIEENKKINTIQGECEILSKKIQALENNAIDMMKLQQVEKITVDGVDFKADEVERWRVNTGDLEKFKEPFSQVGEQESIKEVLQCHWQTLNRVMSLLLEPENGYTQQDLEGLGGKLSKYDLLKYKVK